ncbi:Bifunctional D-cysteine desulfhydrase/1-aminocyclopropane-1-carboxylate deaminase, mitochondrial [Holothuria leucospilota]|uniref:Bifunctional D-cysteine desulfhydrase/1-aminocyclopropane-1-carboxylate deaminase, mitochondrial n=1 Tax=Holothuria leucospilota TaxID=206669 RepID=A0A9Q1H324_HOLLE|nr:Bifunctional D-cysteine desulfhydrase/1-aminocyclopropane-1-carboxylate deaminase, mitochondrial [Holothuria leucospilota]
MTGSTLSGHKVRKLEFHFAEALEKDYKAVIGSGGDVSNYCRAIAVAGKELGFNVHLIQYGVTCKTGVRLEIEGEPAYILPVGDPGDPAIYAYIDTFHELFLQGVTEEFTDLVVSCGRCITTSAFIIGNYLTGGKLRIHALSVNRSKTQCRMRIADMLQISGFLQLVGNGVDAEDLVSVVEASREPKYGVFCDEHLGVTTVYKKMGFSSKRKTFSHYIG